MNYEFRAPGDAGKTPAFAESNAERTLSDYEASPASLRLALIVVAASLGMFLALVPFARQPLGPALWFIPLYQPILVMNDLITMTLLFGYFRLTRRYEILVLGCGYLYSAAMATIHLLTFPGVFASGGLLGAGLQTTGYLHVFWHLGFPVAIIGYAYLKDSHRRVIKRGPPMAKAILATLACAALLGLLALYADGLLPQMLKDNKYSSAFNIGRYGQWVVTGVALAILCTRRSTSALDLWLAVVLSAWFFEIGLVSIFNAGRWDVGFYAGRFYSLLASSFVLIMLLNEHNRMYRDLATAQAGARSAAGLRESREVLRLALQAGRMGVFSWDLRARHAWWSPELEHMVGMSAGTLAPEPDALLNYVFPEDREALRGKIDECFRNGIECSVDFRMRNARGELLWASARGVAQYDEQGRPRQVFGVIADITDKKLGEDATAELEERFHTLANEIPQIAWMARPDGWVAWLNRRWYEYTGLAPEQSEGWAWQGAYDPALRPLALERWRFSIATGAPFELVLPIKGADGKYRQFLSRAVSLRNGDGNIIHWFGSNTDITAQSEAEQALKKADQRKDEFLATLAHELRNPLAPIRNASELLARVTGLAPNIERALTIIDRQSRHLARLVDDLLEVSRITQGKVRLSKKRVSLVDCLTDALHAVEAALKHAGHEVSVHLGDEPLYADADATRIVQCFVNLLNNAIKFTPHGGVIEVRAGRSRGRAQVTISDSGVGIAPEHIKDIFGLFAQVTPALERSHGGLGIGLALVKGFVELHDGSVSAASKGLSQGSTFTVDLPLCEARAQELPEAPLVTHEARMHPRRVLVVDDNLDAAASMVALLHEAGHEVREAHDGKEALKVAFEFEPEVILLDIGLPEMSGLDVARELRRRVGQRSPRIIAVTGWGQESDRKLTRDAGFDFHLTKPVNHTELDVLLSMEPTAPRPPVRH